MIGTAAVGAGMGAYQTIQGAKEQADAKQALANYQRQTLTNPYDNMQVSTRSADLQREEQARLASEQVNALQGGGTRALVGGLGHVEAGNQKVKQDITDIPLAESFLRLIGFRTEAATGIFEKITCYYFSLRLNHYFEYFPF